MKLPIPIEEINQEEFVVRPVTVAGENCHLIFPRAVGPKWTKDNLIFRSSLWNSEGQLISAGFKKFFNYNEAPHIVPDPVTLDNAAAFEKVDGSLLIHSFYKGEHIFRTRGSIDARQMPNGDEIDYFIKKYSKYFVDSFNFHGRVADRYFTSSKSYLFEWVSPKNQIVLFYPEPELKFIGIIHHLDYEYADPTSLDVIAEYYGFQRPKEYKFDTVENLYTSVKALNGEEGVCVYYNNFQDIKKFKSLDYLAKHSFMSKVTDKDTINLFVTLNFPPYTNFYKYVEGQFGWEIAEYAKPYLLKVWETYTYYLDFMNELETALQDLKGKSRKEAADYILNDETLKQNSSFAFNILDGKEPTNEAIRKFLFKKMGLKP